MIVSKWDLHWSVKFPQLLAASLTLLFDSYHVLVRYTFIGEVLKAHAIRCPQSIARPEISPCRST
jgi:hypothetical protein